MIEKDIAGMDSCEKNPGIEQTRYGCHKSRKNMKKLLIVSLCFLLSFPMTACSNEEDSPHTPVVSEVAADITALEETGQEGETMQDSVEWELAINGTDYPIPIALKQLLHDGWKISDRTPYFLYPMVGEDYYEMRTNWSLSKDGEGILPSGSIIRLLEKDGVLLEVTITNQADSETDEPSQKIEDCVVDSITVFYDEAHTSIQLNGKELSSLTPEMLLEDYPVSNGWTHCPSNYRDHPELGVSTEYYISGDLDNCTRTVCVSFDLEDTAFKVSVQNQAPLK